MRTTLRGVLSVAALITFLIACNDEVLFQPPPRGGNEAPPPEAADSVVTLVAFLPYMTIAEAAEAKIPKSIHLAGSGHVACVGVPYVKPPHTSSHKEHILGVPVEVPDFYGPSVGRKQECADYDWYADIGKDGPLRIEKSGSDTRVAQNIHVTGKAGVKGTLAGILSLSGKNIEVRASPATNFSVALDMQWCPTVKVVPVGRWINSVTVEVVGRSCLGFDFGPLGHPEICAGPVNLGLADVLNSELDKHRDDVQQAAQGIVSCGTVREAVGKQWHPFSIRIDRPGQAEFFLNIEPKTAAFSGLIAEDKGITITVRVGAKTTLTPVEIATTATPLPPLEQVVAKQGSLDVSLQAVAPYTFLKNELATSLKGKSFKQNLVQGPVEVRIDDVDVYPSNGSLAVGLKIYANTPGRWFNTGGWVYLIGSPRPVEGGEAIVVDDIAFATVVDNEFWKVAQSLFQTEILSALKDHARFDLSKEIDKATVEITTAIARTELPGLKIAVGRPSITLTGINVASDNLVATAKLSMTFNVEVTAALLK